MVHHHKEKLQPSARLSQRRVSATYCCKVNHLVHCVRHKGESEPFGTLSQNSQSHSAHCHKGVSVTWHTVTKESQNHLAHCHKGVSVIRRTVTNGSQSHSAHCRRDGLAVSVTLARWNLSATGYTGPHSIQVAHRGARDETRCTAGCTDCTHCGNTHIHPEIMTPNFFLQTCSLQTSMFTFSKWKRFEPSMRHTCRGSCCKGSGSHSCW